MKSLLISSKIVDDRQQNVSVNSRQDNGNCKPFMVVKDPSEIYTPGKSVFGTTEIRRNILNGVFVDGTMFLYGGRSLVVENGRLMFGNEEMRI